MALERTTPSEFMGEAFTIWIRPYRASEFLLMRREIEAGKGVIVGEVSWFLNEELSVPDKVSLAISEIREFSDAVREVGIPVKYIVGFTHIRVARKLERHLGFKSQDSAASKYVYVLLDDLMKNIDEFENGPFMDRLRGGINSDN